MEDLYTKLKKAAQEHRCLHHYTTIDALEAILKNRSIRLSRLDKVNDQVENQRIDSIWNNRIFVACFTHDNNEKDMFWNDYAKREQGVKITFNNIINDIELYGDAECKRFRLPLIERADTSYTKYCDVSDWGYKDITIADIEYVEELSKYRVLNKELYDEFKNCKNINYNQFYVNDFEGLVKENKWKTESETRIRVAVKPLGFEYKRLNRQLINIKPDFEYIYMKLDEIFLKNLTITLNPWSNELFYNKICGLLNNIDLANLIKIKR